MSNNNKLTQHLSILRCAGLILQDHLVLDHVLLVDVREDQLSLE